MILADCLMARGLDPATILAHRISLNPKDASADFRCTADLMKGEHVLAYQRMQDGRRFGAEAHVLAFIAEPQGRARLVGFRRLVARRRGNVPGDIVYDYDRAHLLHDFAGRARWPTFYDAFEEEGLDDLFGQLVISWPLPLFLSVKPATTPLLRVLESPKRDGEWKKIAP